MSIPRPTKRSRARHAAVALLALTLGATACTADDGVDSTPVTNLSGDEIVLTSALSTVDDCDALLERIKDEAVERVGPWGFGHGGFGGPIILEGDVDDASEEAAFDVASGDSAGLARAESAPATTVATSDGEAGAGAGTDFSETNNQEQGVDEADLVKTDGRRLVTVSGNQVNVIDVEASTPRLINTIKLPEEFWGGELFLNGDTALLMTSGWTDRPFISRTVDTSWYPGSPTGRLMELDLDRGRIVRTLEFEGGYLSAREIDGSIRIVLSASAERFNFVFPSNDGAADAAEEANRRLIEESTIDQWIPTYRITEGGDTLVEAPIVDCDRVHLPGEFAGFGSLVVLTADIDDGLQINDSLSVFTDAQIVYASPRRLVVATPQWPEFDDDGAPRDVDDFRTAIHTFDISDPERSGYAASGSVRGSMLNQYSMSEHEGHLRVATTEGSPWDSRDSESFVTVFAENGRSLDEVGQVGGLGEGEQIFAVRFLGNKGYVVTFRQIDPLYVVDLADPTNPTVEGELKIPGFSSYLHPFQEDMLIGVGLDGDDEGRTTGAVISLFDVSNPADPIRVDKMALGPSQRFDTSTGGDEFSEGDSYSPVMHDARAFTMWDDTAIVPVGWWRFTEGPDGYREDNGSAAILVDVDADDGFRQIGAVGHPRNEECEGGFGEPEILPAPEEDAEEDAEEPIVVEPEEEASEDAEAGFVRGEDVPAEEEPAAIEVLPGPDGFCFSYQPQIERSVIIGDRLFTYSQDGVAVNELGSLADVVWIPFNN